MTTSAVPSSIAFATAGMSLDLCWASASRQTITSGLWFKAA